MRIERAHRRREPQMTPSPVPGSSGLFTVDATWGTLSPMQFAPGVVTVGELEVIAHVEAGSPLVDTRQEDFFRRGTIPAARNIPHEQIARRREELDEDAVTVLFCNGPQCSATPDAIRALLDAGYPAEALRYYRGGVHDWVTLGLPLMAGGKR